MPSLNLGFLLVVLEIYLKFFIEKWNTISMDDLTYDTEKAFIKEELGKCL